MPLFLLTLKIFFMVLGGANAKYSWLGLFRLPKNPNAAYGQPLEVTCEWNALLSILMPMLSFTYNDMPVKFYNHSVINFTTAEYFFAQPYTAGMLIPFLKWNSSRYEIPCVTVADPLRQLCDFSTFANYITSNVVFSIRSEDQPRTSYTITAPTTVKFQVASVPTSVKEGYICCEINNEAVKDQIQSLLSTDSTIYEDDSCQLLYVGYLPIKPVIAPQDVSIFDLDYLQFKWTTKHYKPSPGVSLFRTLESPYYMSVDNVTYQKLLSHINDNETEHYGLGSKYRLCPQVNTVTNSCTISNAYFDASATAYLVKVNSSSTVGMATSAELLIEILKFVIPSPVSQLRTVNIGSRSAQLKWHHNLVSSYPLTFFLNITCISDICNNENVPKSTRFQSYELNDYEVYNDTVYFEVGSLHPVSNYRVDIKTQLRGRERFSNNAFSVFKTASKTLSTNPVTCPDCYALLPENKDKIVIYWQSIPQWINNEIKSYDLMIDYYGPKETSFKISTEKTSMEIGAPSFKGNATLKVSLTASTVHDKDVSLQPSVIHIFPRSATMESVTVETLRLTSVALNSTFVKVMWASPFDTVTNYTIFWCLRGVGGLCKDDIQWLSTSSTSPVLIHLKQDYSKFAFGVSLNKDNERSGILWSTCIYDVRGDIAPPIIDVEESNPSYIKVHIQPALCYQYGAGIDLMYKLVYCEGKISDITKCSDKMVLVPLLPQGMKVDLTGIRADQYYSVFVASMSQPHKFARHNKLIGSANFDILPSAAVAIVLLIFIMVLSTVGWVFRKKVKNLYIIRWCHELLLPVPIKPPSCNKNIGLYKGPVNPEDSHPNISRSDNFSEDQLAPYSNIYLFNSNWEQVILNSAVEINQYCSFAHGSVSRAQNNTVVDESNKSISSNNVTESQIHTKTVEFLFKNTEGFGSNSDCPIVPNNEALSSTSVHQPDSSVTVKHLLAENPGTLVMHAAKLLNLNGNKSPSLSVSPFLIFCPHRNAAVILSQDSSPNRVEEQSRKIFGNSLNLTETQNTIHKEKMFSEQLATIKPTSWSNDNEMYRGDANTNENPSINFEDVYSNQNNAINYSTLSVQNFAPFEQEVHKCVNDDEVVYAPPKTPEYDCTHLEEPANVYLFNDRNINEHDNTKNVALLYSCKTAEDLDNGRENRKVQFSACGGVESADRYNFIGTNQHLPAAQRIQLFDLDGYEISASQLPASQVTILCDMCPQESAAKTQSQVMLLNRIQKTCSSTLMGCPVKYILENKLFNNHSESNPDNKTNGSEALHEHHNDCDIESTDMNMNYCSIANDECVPPVRNILHTSVDADICNNVHTSDDIRNLSRNSDDNVKNIIQIEQSDDDMSDGDNGNTAFNYSFAVLH